MMGLFEKQFDQLAKKIKARWVNLTQRLKAYLKRLLFPIYLFPVKLFTYTIYYFIKFLIKLIINLIKIIIDCIIFPFRSLKNFLKFIFIIVLIGYMLASLFVIADYLSTQYGYYGKFLCSFGTKDKLSASVVRIVGGYSEGSGFFISEDQVLTNFHVIADEPSPKIIFPKGNFVTPIKIVGNKDADLAILFTEYKYNQLVLPLPDVINFYENEPLIAAGYPLGTTLIGNATLSKGRFIDFRKNKKSPVSYIQTDVSLVQGMSGGPLTDQCGKVVGINTMSMAGLSLFINAVSANELLPGFTDQNIKKINVDPSLSPQDAVTAFYTYLKARRMEEGFKLLSREYLQKTNFEEWTTRFKDILDVNVFISRKFENSKDIVFVKFATKNWVDGEVEYYYYEGTWQTIKEDGVYKMLKSKITEVKNPGWDWFYE